MNNGAADLDLGGFDDFCGTLVTGLLTELGVTGQQAAHVADDIAARAHAFVALTPNERRTVAVPSFEETFYYKPADASALLRAQVGATVRNSALEHVHAHGPLNAGGLTVLTDLAAAPLSRLLAAAERGLVAPPTTAAVTMVADWRAWAAEFPRAWAAIDALGDLVSSGGGRAAWRARPGASVAPLPAPAATASRNEAGQIILDAMVPDFDQGTVEMLTDLSREPGAVLFVTALSRLSRHLGKLLRMLDFLLGSGTAVLTTNYLLRPGEVFARRAIVPVDTHATAPPRDTAGLTGTHRKVYAAVLSDLF